MHDFVNSVCETGILRHHVIIDVRYSDYSCASSFTCYLGESAYIYEFVSSYPTLANPLRLFSIYEQIHECTPFLYSQSSCSNT